MYMLGFVFAFAMATIHCLKGQESDEIRGIIEALNRNVELQRKIKEHEHEEITGQSFQPRNTKISRLRDFHQTIEELRREFEAECGEDGQLCLRSSTKISTFTLYTRNNNRAAINAEDVPDIFDGSKRTIFIVHGYRDSSKSGWQVNFKDEFLLNGDFNVIIVDWSAASSTYYYPSAAQSTRTVGKEIATLCETLTKKAGLDRRNLYCVGHSLGAHTCGFAGKRVKLGRITGLDPAGPWFHTDDTRKRLHWTDADYVDVIHTSYWWGISKSIGHVDFYPNGGRKQPNCFGKLACSHSRARDYFKVSINNPCFVVHIKCNDENNFPDSCMVFSTVVQSMGYPAEDYKERGIFFLKTTGSGSYCLPEEEPIMIEDLVIPQAISFDIDDINDVIMAEGTVDMDGIDGMLHWFGVIEEGEVALSEEEE